MENNIVYVVSYLNKVSSNLYCFIVPEKTYIHVGPIDPDLLYPELVPIVRIAKNVLLYTLVPHVNTYKILSKPYTIQNSKKTFTIKHYTENYRTGGELRCSKCALYAEFLEKIYNLTVLLKYASGASSCCLKPIQLCLCLLW